MKQNNSNEKNKNESFITILKDLERAKPKPNLFARIEDKILEETHVYSQNITSFQLRIASAAAVLLIVTNSYLIFGLNQNTNHSSQDEQTKNSSSIISDFKIYE